MSDITDVNITGTGDLPDWATEGTAAKIEAHLNKMLQITKADQLKMKKMLAEMASDRKLTKRTTEEASRAVRHNKTTGKTATGTAKPKTKSGNLFDSRGLTDGLGSFTDSVIGSNKHLKTLSDELRLSGVSLKNFRKGLGLAVIGGVFSLLGKIIGKAITNIEQTTEAMTVMYESGIRFNGGIIDLQRTMAETGMTLEQVTKIGEQYSAVMMSKGMTGIRSIVTGAGEASGGLHKLALTTAEAADYAAEYLDTQRLAGVISSYTEKQQSKMLAENIQRLTDYSKILGVSRKAMLDNQKAYMNQTSVLALFARMSKEERKVAQEGYRTAIDAMTALGPQMEGLIPYFTDIFARDFGEEATSERFKELATNGAPQLALAFQTLAQRAKKEGKVTLDMLRDTIGSVEKSQLEVLVANPRYRELGEALLAAGFSFEQATELEAERAKQIERALPEFAKSIGLEHDMNAARAEYLRRQQSNIESMKLLDDSMNKLKASWNFLLTKGLLDIMGGLIAKLLNKPLSDVMGDISGGVADFAKWIREIADNGIFQKIGTGIGVLIEKFIQWASDPTSLFVDIVNAIKAGFNLVVDAIKNFDIYGKLNPLRNVGSSSEKNIATSDALFGTMDRVKGWFGDDEAEARADAMLADSFRNLSKIKQQEMLDFYGKVSPALKEKLEKAISEREGKQAKKAAQQPTSKKETTAQPAQTTQEKVQPATPVNKPLPAVKKEDEEARKKKAAEEKKDNIADILKTGSNDQLGMLDDIRQLMAMSTRSLETIAKRTATGGALLQS
jgi:hypothetical protein